jgi:enoyl-CoA hydratase
MNSGLKIEDHDGVRLLRMQFGSANALGPTVVTELRSALRASATPTVLTGERRAFSGGLNLLELSSYGREEMVEFVTHFSGLMLEALAAPYPLVAAVNGHAVAGGCVLAMACDRRVGVDGPFKVGMNEMAIGLTLPSVVTEILRGKLSPEHAHTVILGGALYPPSEALGVGLLDDVADGVAAAESRAVEIARGLGRSLAEFAAMKRSLVAPIVRACDGSREELDTAFVDSWFAEPASRLRASMIERLRERD